MTVSELKTAVMALPLDEKKSFILEALPGLTSDAMADPSFMMELLPVLLGIVKKSGIDIQQLLQFAMMMQGAPAGENC